MDDFFSELGKKISETADIVGKKTNEILRSFKIDRLVFASNWPFSRIISSEEVYDDYMKILDYCNFNDEEIHKIAYQNIKDFLEGK